MLTNFKPKQQRPMPMKEHKMMPTTNEPTGETMSEGDTSGMTDEGDPLLDYVAALDESEKQRLLAILTEQLQENSLDDPEVADIEGMEREMNSEEEI